MRISQTGVKKVILREKDLSLSEYTELAKRVASSCESCGVQCIIHAFPETARELGIKALHMPLHMLTKQLCEEFDIVGSSVHSVDEAVKAQQLGASYITAGHIFATDCKKGLAPRGLDFLKDVCRSVDIPVYAIGGISEKNMGLTLEAGAEGVCIMSGLMKI